MASGNNNSDRNSTLPAPELNPLLNPVLGAHMGRWAEVYFTSPPEKREEAVLDLLRELQGGDPAPPPLADAPDSAHEQLSEIPSELAQKPNPQKPNLRNGASPGLGDPSSQAVSPSPNEANESEVDWIVCESCGGRNIPGNRYCGMCAEPLTQGNAVIAEPRKETMWGTLIERTPERDRENLEDKSLDHTKNLDYKIFDYQDQDTRSDLTNDAGGRDEPRFAAPIDSLRNDPPLSPSSSWPERPAVPSLLVEYDQPTNRRRMYVGAIVGILIAGLVYVAWRASANRSDTAHILPQPAPTAAETQPPAADQPPPSAPPQNDATQAAAPKAPTTVEARPAPAATTRPHRRIDTTGARETNAATPASPAKDQAAGPIVAPLLGNGSEELTVAESYLNGTNGKVRDPSEAAKWLWRSFGKKNTAAALLLSDLYVRGEGVPQSCDQARLLLDAAARKGAAGAAERITSLPSRGCP